MKAVVQRVIKACVKVDNQVTGQIKNGLLVLLAISNTDSIKEIEWMSNKIVNLRVFSDEYGKMNRSVTDINGDILIISNFTVYGDTSKGFRPSYIKSAKAEISEPLYHQMVEYMREKYPIKIKSGIFGAMMNVELVNDGPVTVIIEKEYSSK